MTEIYASGLYARATGLYADYAWALDMADIDGLLAICTEDFVFQDTAGNLYEGLAPSRAYFEALVATPAFRGRQHHIDKLRLKPCAGGFEALSYWTVTKWDVAAESKRFDVVGYARDILRLEGDQLKLAERRVYYWRNIDCPWVPDGTQV